MSLQTPGLEKAFLKQGAPERLLRHLTQKRLLSLLAKGLCPIPWFLNADASHLSCLLLLLLQPSALQPAKPGLPRSASSRVFSSLPSPVLQATGLHFRHTDNVIQWLNAMAEIGLPKVSSAWWLNRGLPTLGRGGGKTR